MTDRLLRAGFSEELAEDAVSYVKDYGYINDRRYALNYIMYRIHDKSRQKIFQELSGKGIDRQTIQDAWEEAEELETCLLYTSGINLGTLGFLAEIDKTSIYTALDKLFADDYEIEERMMLTGTVWRGDKITGQDVALNDIVISRVGPPLRVIGFNNYVNDGYLNSYNADGIIIATPTGSTGYSLSCGGPIISPNAAMTVMTPIAPHTLNTRSIIFPEDDVILSLIHI